MCCSESFFTFNTPGSRQTILRNISLLSSSNLPDRFSETVLTVRLEKNHYITGFHAKNAKIWGFFREILLLSVLRKNANFLRKKRNFREIKMQKLCKKNNSKFCLKNAKIRKSKAKIWREKKSKIFSRIFFVIFWIVFALFCFITESSIFLQEGISLESFCCFLFGFGLERSGCILFELV